MTGTNLPVPAPVDTPAGAPSSGCSAPPAGTQRALPCVLAFGVLPHDGLPQRLQPPDIAYTRARRSLGAVPEGPCRSDSSAVALLEA
jgi:hypothetical protein